LKQYNIIIKPSKYKLLKKGNHLPKICS